jgi:hypothetical protein
MPWQRSCFLPASTAGNDACGNLKEESIMRTHRKTTRTLALAALLVAGLGGRIAHARDFCVAECRQDRLACVKECATMSGCGQLYASCKQHCVDSSFGEDRADCIKECKSERADCQTFLTSCKDNCKEEFTGCKTDCFNKPATHGF